MADSEVINLKEIQVDGLQRSGNHAIVHWIASQCRGTALVLSDAAHGSDPFLTMSEFLEYRGGKVVRMVETWDAPSQAPTGRAPLLKEFQDGRVVSEVRTWDREARLAAVRQAHAYATP